MERMRGLSHVGSPLDIEVWDAAGEGRTVVSELWQTANQPGADPALATFLIHAKDDPVRIRFTNLYEGTQPPIARLNAFSITLIPEPNALLWGWLACCWCAGGVIDLQKRGDLCDCEPTLLRTGPSA